MIAMKQGASRDQGRRAFTLVELMVVIGIMGILAALTAGAVILYMSTQRANNTKTFLAKINTRLNASYQAAKDAALNQPIPQNYAGIIYSMAGTDGNRGDRAKVIWAKAYLKQNFPMSFAEALNPAPLPPLKVYQNYLAKYGVTAGNTPPQNFESSACLLMALQRSDSGGGTTAEDLGGGGSSADFPIAGGKTIKALVDGWGNPLQFCRWPSGSSVLNPNGAQAGFNDPLDPQGLLNNTTWQNAMAPGTQQNNLTTFANYFHPLSTTSNLSFRLVPLVASAGPDGIMSLDPNTMAPQGENANDNLYSISN